jgi:hypothetical protein
LKGIRLALFFDRPAQIAREEAHRLPRGRELVVIEEDHPARANQAAQVRQVDENMLEAVVAVDEGKVEREPL